MRIIFATNNYTPYSGGVVSSIQAMVDGLHHKKHEVIVVSLDFLGISHNDPHYVRRVKSPIRFFYKQNYMAIPWRPTQYMKQLVKSYRPDIMHVHHPFLLGISGLHAARSIDIPCVFTYHTLYEQYAHYLPVPQPISQQLIKYTVHNFCTSVNSIIVPSNAIKNHLHSQKILSPIEVIPSPLRTPFLSDFLNIISKDTQPFFELLTVSRFVPEKNIPFIFEIFKLLPTSIRLTLVGYGADYENIQRLAFDIIKLPRNRIRFIHKPEQNDLLSLYRSSHLFLFSSKTDTQGLVMVEAMSQGLPVIAIDGPGQRDIIQNGMNGFIIDTAHQAATLIVNIMNNSPLYNHLSTGAYATSQKYHPHHITTQLINFYHTTIN